MDSGSNSMSGSSVFLAFSLVVLLRIAGWDGVNLSSGIDTIGSGGVLLAIKGVASWD